MSGSSSVFPPLYNMGGGIPRVESNLIPGLPSDVLPGFYLACDKVRLRFSTSIPDRICEEFVGGSFGPFRRGRNFGASEVQSRTAWLDDGAIFLKHEEKLGSLISAHSLICEFNPNRLGAFGCWRVGSLLRLFGFDPLQGAVERFDYCLTAERDPYGIHLDSRYSKPDRIGGTARGHETERLGYRKGSKHKFQRYDKSAEARNRGVDAPDGIVRLEHQAWGVGAPDDPSQMLLFRDLGLVECPLPDHFRALERKRAPDEFGDELWELFAWASQTADPKVIRRLSRSLLPGRTNERAETAEMVLYDDLTPGIRETFSRLWSTVVGCVSRFVCAVEWDQVSGVLTPATVSAGGDGAG